MTATPLVSIVIPTYNRVATIARALDSVIGQSHRPLEIIVVDDGSTDETLAAIDHEACPVPLTVISLGHNEGAAAARNHGITLARGDFVAFLDSDDEWQPDKIAKQLAALDTAGLEYGASYTGIASYAEDGALCAVSRAVAGGDLRQALLNHNLVGSTSCVLARRTLLQQIGGFDRSLAACQDWDLWLRLAGHTRFVCVPEPLTLVHIAREGRISTNGHARLSGYLQLYRTHLRRPFKAGLVDSSLFRTNLGEIFMQLDRPGYARRQFAALWRAKPWSIKRFTLLVLAWFGIGKARYFRIATRLERLEAWLRPSPIATSGLAATPHSGRRP
ncbi:MAG: glycosyltransferase family A protein [Aliidongia sp.]